MDRADVEVVKWPWPGSAALVAGTRGWSQEQQGSEGRVKERAVQDGLGNGKVLSLQRRLGRASSIALSLYNNSMCQHTQLWPEISSFAGDGLP